MPVVIGMKAGEWLGIDSRSRSRRAGDIREASGRARRSNRALRYFPPAVGGIRLNPVGSAVRLVHWLLDKLLGPDSAAISRIPARWFIAPDYGLMPAPTRPIRSAEQDLIDAAPKSFSERWPARRRRVALTICLRVPNAQELSLRGA